MPYSGLLDPPLVCDDLDAPTYAPEGILFDGSTDFMLRGGNLTGVENAPTGTVSVWARVDAPQGALQVFLANTSNRFNFRVDANNKFNLVLQNAAGATILSGVQTGLATSGQYNHVLIAWDLANAFVGFFVDDVDVTPASPTIVDDLVGYEQSEWVIGATTVPTFMLLGALADLYFTTKFIDPVEANRRKFIDANGNPVFLGNEGERPTGTPPAVYLRGNQTDQGLNSGTGGDFVSQATQVPGETFGPVLVGINDIDPTAFPTPHSWNGL